MCDFSNEVNTLNSELELEAFHPTAIRHSSLHVWSPSCEISRLSAQSALQWATSETEESSLTVGSPLYLRCSLSLIDSVFPAVVLIVFFFAFLSNHRQGKLMCILAWKATCLLVRGCEWGFFFFLFGFCSLVS